MTGPFYKRDYTILSLSDALVDEKDRKSVTYLLVGVTWDRREGLEMNMTRGIWVSVYASLWIVSISRFKFEVLSGSLTGENIGISEGISEISHLVNLRPM